MDGKYEFSVKDDRLANAQTSKRFSTFVPEKYELVRHMRKRGLQGGVKHPARRIKCVPHVNAAPILRSLSAHLYGNSSFLFYISTKYSLTGASEYALNNIGVGVQRPRFMGFNIVFTGSCYL